MCVSGGVRRGACACVCRERGRDGSRVGVIDTCCCFCGNHLSNAIPRHARVDGAADDEDALVHILVINLHEKGVRGWWGSVDGE